MVIIAGDVYDTSNPPAGAETLFYKTICKLADNGNRCVLVRFFNKYRINKFLRITIGTDEEMNVLIDAHAWLAHAFIFKIEVAPIVAPYIAINTVSASYILADELFNPSSVMKSSTSYKYSFFR